MAEMDLADDVNLASQNEKEMEMQPAADDGLVFASSSVELEVDNEALYLGTNKPHDPTREGKQRPKELTATTARAISNTFGGARVSGDVTYLQHGTYDTKPATLLGFNFRFKFEPGSASRFTRAEIWVTFDSHGENVTAGTPPKPAVKHYAPALICGPVSLGQVAKSVAVLPSISAPTLPVQTGIGVTMTKSTTAAREFQMKVIGEPSTDDDEAEEEDTIGWWITENAAQDDGIPRELKSAVLVQHKDSGEAFQATVHVKVRTRMGLSLFGWPWSKRTPLVISNKERFGKAAITTTFDDLEDKDWLQLTEFPGLVQRIRISDKSKEKIC
ncbi:hypothetical protein A1O3_03643 [Capronia epimyces CBS 606.96]|uniref:Uncharacterized protein n=1 Tax=Capronia epimyces CBS 606.96 TaxID=1182542 RepID=W9YAK3_9EURO|nr:uncharacterized protein A1O3_03643 [Capronia epimyces CBS 606.96]EXJ86690.1 hypothetical protein A1O3_03643 [Capronia epimyces CBS 606.96]